MHILSLEVRNNAARAAFAPETTSPALHVDIMHLHSITFVTLDVEGINHVFWERPTQAVATAFSFDMLIDWSLHLNLDVFDGNARRFSEVNSWT